MHSKLKLMQSMEFDNIDGEFVYNVGREMFL